MSGLFYSLNLKLVPIILNFKIFYFMMLSGSFLMSVHNFYKHLSFISKLMEGKIERRMSLIRP